MHKWKSITATALAVSLFVSGMQGTGLEKGKQVCAETIGEEKKVAVAGDTYSAQSAIPTLQINIDETKGTIADMNGDSKHETKCYGTMTLTIPDDYESEYGTLGDAKLENMEMQIKGRGNASWSNQKKPYKIKLSEKADLFGMGSNKHWVLLTNAYEMTYMKNKLLYDLADSIGLAYSPQSVYVDVVMNGTYLGNYLLCEQIRVGKSRVNIDDLEEETEITDSTITGGYLVNCDSYATDEDVHFVSKNRKAFELVSPSFEDGITTENQAQYDYITGYLQRLEDAVYAENYTNAEGETVEDLMDIDSFVNYFLLEFFSDNVDAFYNSTYMYKPRGGKLCWGPVWDFDFCMGKDEDDGTGTAVVDSNNRYMVKQLLAMPGVAEKINTRYKEIRDKLVSLYASGGYVDQQAERIRDSVTNDMKAWIDMYGKIYNYANQLENWKEWMEARVSFMDRYLPTLLKEEPIATTSVPQETPQITPQVTVMPTQTPQSAPQTTASPVTNCSITLDAQGGTFLSNSDDSIRVLRGAAGSTYYVKMQVMKRGYTFAGWYTEVIGGEKIEEDQLLLLEQDVTYYAHWQKVTVSKGKIKSLKAAKHQVKVTIASTSQAAGYEVVYATKKSFKNAKRKNSSSKSVTISKLKSGKVYYIKVRAYKLDSASEKVYGSYSVSRKVKVK